jgi:hypothetical protein
MTTLRAWTLRCGVVLLGLFSLGTSPANWEVVAKGVPATTSGGQNGLLVTVSASHPAAVDVRDPDGTVRSVDEFPPRAPGTPWRGTARYFLKPGRTLEGARIGGGCAGCTCSKRCTPPPGAFVDITDAEPVAMWTATATSDPVTVEMGRDLAGVTVVVEGIDSAEESLGVVPENDRDATGFGPGRAHRRFSGTSEAGIPTTTFEVQWPRAAGSTGTIVTSYRFTPTIVGPCPSLDPCAPPPGAAPRVASVTKLYW